MSRTLRRLFWWVPLGRAPELSAKALQAELSGSSPPYLLDVRTRIEWRKSRIPGAVNVPIGELRRRLPELRLDPERPVVAICLSAHRSIPAVRLLELEGFGGARQLKGGMLAWWKAKLPTEA
ncbi:MAG: rhodanese-like domain-containing protein [Pseudomonadota bacterium]|nr:rhodanese-like domain-containing protein [Pseudomonadota bacterium]